ncbi:hypothetical protein BKA69DRAFT_1053086 [Paraphysoderma sedebokerense]|nr:hypothetical protein BKA69DRAFT_1053086 [Paraphysoderma sedebokerense]
MNGYVFAWIKSPGESTLYYSENGTDPYQRISLTLGNAGFIHDVAVQSVFDSIAILVRDNGGLDKVVVFDIFDRELKDGVSFPLVGGSTAPLDDGSKNPVLGLTESGQGTGELLAWGGSLAYLPIGGLVALDITLKSRDPARPASGLGNTETILEVATSADGSYALLTSLNRIFYGKFGHFEAIELIGGLNQTEGKQAAS